jgi:hypothetical protein
MSCCGKTKEEYGGHDGGWHGGHDGGYGIGP